VIATSLHVVLLLQESQDISCVIDDDRLLLSYIAACHRHRFMNISPLCWCLVRDIIDVYNDMTLNSADIVINLIIIDFGFTFSFIVSPE